MQPSSTIVCCIAALAALHFATPSAFGTEAIPVRKGGIVATQPVQTNFYVDAPTRKSATSATPAPVPADTVRAAGSAQLPPPSQPRIKLPAHTRQPAMTAVPVRPTASQAAHSTVLDRTRGLFGRPAADTFNTDYKTRTQSETTPPFLRGCGLDGKNIPIGQEDAYRQCLPEDYMPTDLVQLPRDMSYYNMVLYLRREPAEALIRMIRDAERQGLRLQVFSAYRDYNHQRRLYAEAVSKGRRGSVAKPGYSEHMLGTTVDITNSEKHLMRRSFQDTPEGRWVARNAAKYGWKATVVAGSGSRSHVDEPWHIRYFGPGRIPQGRPSSLTVAGGAPTPTQRVTRTAGRATAATVRAATAPVRAGGGLFGRLKGAVGGRR